MEVCVRINGCQNATALEDIEEGLVGDGIVNTLVLPKVESAEDVEWAIDVLRAVLGEKNPEVSGVRWTRSPVSVGWDWPLSG